MEFNHIFVAFEVTPMGMRCMRYANSLAAALSVPLKVVVPLSVREMDVVLQAVRAHGDLSVSNPVEGAVTFLKRIGIAAHDVQTEAGDDMPAQGTIVLASGDDTYVITHGDEAEVFRGEKGSVCIPFGDGTSQDCAACIGLPIAKALGVDVLFYHTTWKRDDVDSGDPRDHMCDDARIVMARLERYVALADVRAEFVIETAETVVGGIVRFATRNGCCLIAADRGKGVLRGSYTDDIIANSPIPVITPR